MKRHIVILLFLAIQTFAQTGPGGVGTNDGTSFLKIWLDAGKGVGKDSLGKKVATDTDRILFWTDLSGSKNHVKATADSSRPTLNTNNLLLNNQPVLRFTRDGGAGNKSNFMVTSSFPKTTDVTIYCVFHALTKGGGNNVSPFQSKSGTNNMWYSGSGLVDADVSVQTLNDISMTLTDTSIAAGCGDSTAQNNFTVKAPAHINKTVFGVLEKVASTGILSISRDGDTEHSYQAGKSPLSSSLRYSIGATSSRLYAYNYFDGYISTVLVFNKKLAEAERIMVDNYVSAKYAIPLAQRDFFKMDDVGMGNYDFELAGIGMGNDKLPQIRAKGEGIIELSNPTNLELNEYLIWAHNGQSLSYQLNDIPEGVKQRITRTWRVSEVGETGLVDLVVDTKGFSSEEQDLVLLVDTDNNGLFDNETLGNGMLVQSKYLGNGQYLFQKVNLNNETRFTFGTLKPACQADCDAVFTPNADGVSDTYYIENVGKTVILDKFGQLTRELTGPTYWDGIKSNGTLAKEGLYFIISNDARQKTVTLLK